jgi:predicted site-specific integrase-resolvase
MYNLTKYLKDHEKLTHDKIKICYCRVSSRKQKEDLQRQVEYMKEKYPEHRIITDVGSGINYERNGLNEIIDIAIRGELEELVITYKDRLTRFGYEMIERIIKK